jgi:hypothetical protein
MVRPFHFRLSKAPGSGSGDPAAGGSDRSFEWLAAHAKEVARRDLSCAGSA